MTNIIEQSLKDLCEARKSIIKKVIDTGEELTRGDIFILRLYEKERAKVTTVPKYKKFISGAKEIFKVYKDVIEKINMTDETPQINDKSTSNDDNNIKIDDEFIIDTDMLI